MELTKILTYKTDSVSGLTPTCNRSLFIPNLIKIWLNQNYDLLNRELIIIDDSEIFYGDKIKWCNIPGFVKFYYSKNKINIGKKRNLLNRLSNGKWLVCYDDDDYYFENRLNYCINLLKENNKLIGGSSKLYLYSPINNIIYSSKFFGKNHCTNATLIYYYTLLIPPKNLFYCDDNTKNEEKFFLKNYLIDIYQFNSLKIIIVIAHLLNTVNKYDLLSNFTKTSLNPEFVLGKELMNFYKHIIRKQIR